MLSFWSWLTFPHFGPEPSQNQLPTGIWCTHRREIYEYFKSFETLESLRKSALIRLKMLQTRVQEVIKQDMQCPENVHTAVLMYISSEATTTNKDTKSLAETMQKMLMYVLFLSDKLCQNQSKKKKQASSI